MLNNKLISIDILIQDKDMVGFILNNTKYFSSNNLVALRIYIKNINFLQVRDKDFIIIDKWGDKLTLNKNNLTYRLLNYLVEALPAHIISGRSCIGCIL